MRLAISMAGEGLDGPFDARFGRAARFCLVDSDSDDCTMLDNPGLEASGGAGVRAAQLLADQGIGAVVSGAYGPKAWVTLQTAGIRALVAPAQAGLSGRQVLERFRVGGLSGADAPSHDGHQGG